MKKKKKRGAEPSAQEEPLFFLRNRAELSEHWRPPQKRRRIFRCRTRRLTTQRMRRRIPNGVDWAEINGRVMRLEEAFPEERKLKRPIIPPEIVPAELGGGGGGGDGGG